MAKNEHTSAKAGKAASRVLKDGRTGEDSKTAARQEEVGGTAALPDARSQRSPANVPAGDETCGGWPADRATGPVGTDAHARMAVPREATCDYVPG